MTKYIRIMNEVSGPVKRTYLEKLGISTKRDDDKTIGQFGSGSKLAPIAALRNGWEWINTGSDNDGDYIMNYVVKKDDEGIEHIFFDYGDYQTPSSYTIDAGLLSWTNPFQVFREAFANALDEFTANGSKYSVDIVDRVEHISGHFCTFITADPELTVFVRDLDRYFITERKPVCTTYSYTLYKPYNRKIGAYCKTVLVNYEDSKQDQYAVKKFMSGVFDIDSSFPINEERRMMDENYNIASTITAKILTSASKEILMAYLNESPFYSNFFEYNIAEYWAVGNPDIKEAFLELHGNAVIVPGDCDSMVIDNIYAKKRKVLKIPSPFWYRTLEKSGVDTAAIVLQTDTDMVIAARSELKSEELKAFDKALAIVKSFDPRISQITSIEVFKPRVGQTFIGLMKKFGNVSRIYISNNILDDMNLLVGTLVHELDHHITGMKDGAGFRDSADNRIGALMQELYELKNA